MSAQLNIHALLFNSKANGPGLRTVIWFQGCSIGCRECFNPGTHPFAAHILYTPEALATHIISKSEGADGITLSGGEPLDQAEGLLFFLETIHSTSRLSIILLSGYTFENITKMAYGPSILRYVDVLIAGPFVREKIRPEKLAGSENKTYHFFSNRITPTEFDRVSDFEVVIQPDGTLVVSGIQPATLEGLGECLL